MHAKTGNGGHKLYLDNISSSPLDNLHTKTINCRGTVRPNREGMPKNFGYTLELKRGEED